MAYGVKFRLEFSDTKGNYRVAEILQKDYDGDIFPLVGQANPVVIKWDGDDDFYSPIIGSSCMLNLFETADTLYDAFYAAGEREYKVRIATGSLDNADKVWNTESDQWEQANYLWEGSGGTGGSSEIYWEGWLQVDQYKESLQPFPNPINLVAYDGLGSLDAYDAPYSNAADGGYDSNEDTMFFYLYYALNNIQLDFDIYVSNDIRKSTGNANDTLYHDIILNEYGVFDDLDFRNAKEILQSFLKATNSRVFQSQGRWYIISNSNLIDTNINQLFNFDIGFSIENQLATTGEEVIEYKVFDRLGNYKFTTTENVLLKSPTDLKPIGADLYKEYLRPYNQVKYDVKLNDLNYINQNPQFLYDDHQWEFGTNTAINTDSSYALVGTKSVKTTVHGVNVNNPYTILTNEIDTTVSDETKEYNVGFSFFVDPDATLTNFSDEFKYEIAIWMKGIASNGDVVYYDFKNEEWSELGFAETTNNKKRNKKKSFTKVGTWQNFETDLKAFGDTDGDFKIQMRIRYPNFTTYPNPSISLINATYFDKVYIAEKVDLASKMIATNTQNAVNTTTAQYEVKDVFVSNYLGATNFQGGYDGFFKRPRDFTIRASDFPTVDNIISQEILNDFRDFVKRYEGTFYNLKSEPIPIAPHNKVWIDYGSGTFREGASCYIDSMTYNVKANEYEMTMHVPNQTNDVASTFGVKLKK
jgi:hypothetical protein